MQYRVGVVNKAFPVPWITVIPFADGVAQIAYGHFPFPGHALYVRRKIAIQFFLGIAQQGGVCFKKRDIGEIVEIGKQRYLWKPGNAGNKYETQEFVWGFDDREKVF